MSRTIKTGSIAYVAATVTEKTGQVISAYTWQVSTVVDDAGPATPVGEWGDPHESSAPVGTSAFRLVLRVDTVAAPVTDRVRYRVFARPVTGDESEIVDCGTYTVIP